MKARLCAHLLLFFAPALLPAQELSFSFDDVEEFEDFTLHENESASDAEIIFGRELKLYWERRLSRLLPDGWTLELHFTDIDMAGQMQPMRTPTQEWTRVYTDYFPPRLMFDYKILSAEGEEVDNGQEKLLDKHHDFGGSGKMARVEFVFAYELETLRKWLAEKNLVSKKVD